MLDPQEIISAMVEQGALEIDAMDSETGEIVYKVTDRLKEIAPAFYREISDQAYRDILSLWDKGLLEMNILLDSPEVSPTEAGLDRSNWKNLSAGEYGIMNTVMRRFEGGL
jgi:hypothetical protein